MYKCPECGGYEINIEPEGHHCRNCGLVLDDSPLEQEPLLAKGTHVSLPGLSVAGSAPVNGKIVRHSWLMSTRQKNLHKAKHSLESIGMRLRLPNVVVQESYLIFKNAVDRNLNLGRDNMNMVYGSVYAACIMHGVPKTPFELTAFTDINKHEMLKAYKVLKSKLGIKLEVVDPTDYIHRFGSRLYLNPQTISLATELLHKVKGSSIVVGKHPEVIAAAVLYIASKMNQDERTQREVANATGVFVVSIRKRSREIITTL